MDLKELYNEMRIKLQYMYDHNKDSVMLEPMEFFRLFKALCDLMQIKNITDNQ